MARLSRLWWFWGLVITGNHVFGTPPTPPPDPLVTPGNHWAFWNDICEPSSNVAGALIGPFASPRRTSLAHQLVRWSGAVIKGGKPHPWGDPQGEPQGNTQGDPPWDPPQGPLTQGDPPVGSSQEIPPYSSGSRFSDNGWGGRPPGNCRKPLFSDKEIHQMNPNPIKQLSGWQLIWTWRG